MSKPKHIQQRFNNLVEIGCAVCGQPPQIHHCIGQEFGTGKGLKANDELTFGLCHNHHVGSEGIHVIGRTTWEKRFHTQQLLLEITNIKLKNMPQVIGR